MLGKEVGKGGKVGVDDRVANSLIPAYFDLPAIDAFDLGVSLS